MRTVSYHRVIESSVAMLVAALAGCVSTSGQPIDHSAMDKLVKGKSTRADAVALLGQPGGSQSMPDGSSQAVYTYSSINTSFYGVPGSGNASWEECRLGFDARGLYTGAQCNSTSNTPSTR